MFKKCLVFVALIGVTAGVVFAAEDQKDKKADKPKPQAPSLDELKAIIQPMIANLDLTAEQQAQAKRVMRPEAWSKALAAFEGKRGGELRQSMHKLIPETMPTIMMPRMMKYNMQKTMKERMAKKAGPPTPEEIEAIRAATRTRMRAKLAPTIMGHFEQLTAERIKELRIDKRVLVRVLAEQISDTALTDDQKSEFEKVLANAGYPKQLVEGADPILADRVKEMLEKVADDAIADLKKADEASQEKSEPRK
jgi:hypothetical protein